MKLRRWIFVCSIFLPVPDFDCGGRPARRDASFAAKQLSRSESGSKLPHSIGVTYNDVTRAAGIHFINAASADKRYIVESMGGGVALFDFDNDGRLDIYLVNSYTVEAALARRPRPHAALYRNRGDGTFEDVAANAGVADPGWAMGVSVADYDNDGYDDLYVTCFGPNRLYRGYGRADWVQKR